MIVIKSISEAFSMQPRFYETIPLKSFENTLKFNPDHARELCKEIRLEVVNIIVDGLQKQFNVYTGYNFENQRLFECLATSVNVQYEV